VEYEGDLVKTLGLSEKKLGRDKHSSLFCLAISDRKKKFHNIETRKEFEHQDKSKPSL